MYGNALAVPTVSTTRSRTKIRKIRKLLRKGPAVIADFTLKKVKKTQETSETLRICENLKMVFWAFLCPTKLEKILKSWKNSCLFNSMDIIFCVTVLSTVEEPEKKSISICRLQYFA